jgi:hypothetical protein
MYCLKQIITGSYVCAAGFKKIPYVKSAEKIKWYRVCSGAGWQRNCRGERYDPVRLRIRAALNTDGLVKSRISGGFVKSPRSRSIRQLPNTHLKEV